MFEPNDVLNSNVIYKSLFLLQYLSFSYKSTLAEGVSGAIITPI